MKPLRHIRFGLWSLCCFLGLGLFLEGLLGFKVGWYLDVGNDARRVMFTLAHAHGTLLALVNLAAGLLVRTFALTHVPGHVSTCLIAAALLLPIGFLLGGVVIHDGDPGLGILLTPLGAVLLLYAIARLALAFRRVT